MPSRSIDPHQQDELFFQASQATRASRTNDLQNNQPPAHFPEINPRAPSESPILNSLPALAPGIRNPPSGTPPQDPIHHNIRMRDHRPDYPRLGRGGLQPSLPDAARGEFSEPSRERPAESIPDVPLPLPELPDGGKRLLRVEDGQDLCVWSGSTEEEVSTTEGRGEGVWTCRKCGGVDGGCGGGGMAVKAGGRGEGEVEEVGGEDDAVEWTDAQIKRWSEEVLGVGGEAGLMVRPRTTGLEQPQKHEKTMSASARIEVLHTDMKMIVKIAAMRRKCEMLEREANMSLKLQKAVTGRRREFAEALLYRQESRRDSAMANHRNDEMGRYRTIRDVVAAIHEWESKHHGEMMAPWTLADVEIAYMLQQR